jgi:hypothetical protein
VGAGGDDLAVLFDRSLLEPVEIVEERLPFGLEALVRLCQSKCTVLAEWER